MSHYINQDCLINILQFLLEKDKDFYQVRTVSSFWLKTTKMIWNQPIQRVFSSKTMIDIKKCCVCQQTSNKIKSVPYFWFPLPVYVYCDNFNCTRTVIRSMMFDADENNIALLLHEAVVKEGACPRSDGSSSCCLFMKGFIWKGDIIRVRCILENAIKDVELNKIEKKYRTEYKILKL